MYKYKSHCKLNSMILGQMKMRNSLLSKRVHVFCEFNGCARRIHVEEVIVVRAVQATEQSSNECTVGIHGEEKCQSHACGLYCPEMFIMKFVQK